MTLMEFWYFLGMIVAIIMYIPLGVILFAIFYKYPIRTFMRAKALGFNPLPNRRLKIVALSDDKELAKTSDGSFVFTKPEDYFIEAKTGKPCVLMDSLVGHTISLDGFRLMTILKENGYENYEQIAAAVAKDPKAKIEIGGKSVKATKAMFDKLKGEVEAGTIVVIDDIPIKLTDEIIKAIKKDGKAIIKVEGKSLSLSNAVDFFKESIPGTVIETAMQYISQVEALRQRKKDLMQWIVILGFFVICIGFAVLLISYAAPPAVAVAENLAETGARTGVR